MLITTIPFCSFIRVDYYGWRPCSCRYLRRSSVKEATGEKLIKGESNLSGIGNRIQIEFNRVDSETHQKSVIITRRGVSVYLRALLLVMVFN